MKLQLATVVIMTSISISNTALSQTQLPMCDLVKRVIAARADDFASIRGPEKELLGGKMSGLFIGKLIPGPNTDCTVGRGQDRVYLCKIVRAESMIAMKPIYERYKAELIKCFPDISFDDETIGSEEKHNEQWHVYGQNAVANVDLT